MAEKQIDFPALQKEVRWIAPCMLVLSLVCIAVVVAVLTATDLHSFIGPWG